MKQFRPILKLKPVDAHHQRKRKWRIVSDHADVKAKFIVRKAGRLAYSVQPGRAVRA